MRLGARAPRDVAAFGCVEVVARSEGKKFVAMAVHPPENLREGVETKFIFGSDLNDNEVSKVVYEDFLPKALRGGYPYRCAGSGGRGERA